MLLAVIEGLMYKHILVIVNSLDPSQGGVERVTQTITKGFQSRGCICYFCYFEGDCPSGLVSERSYKVSVDISKHSLVTQIVELISDHKIDLVISQGITRSKYLYLYRQIKKQTNAKFAFCFHSSPDYIDRLDYGSLSHSKGLISPFFGVINYRIHKRRELRKLKQIYRTCDRFVLLSPSYLIQMQAQLGLDEGRKFCSIANPLSFDIMPDEIDIGAKEKKVLIVSRLLESHKRISIAIRIWHAIEMLGYSDWRMIVVGRGKDEAMYLRMASEYGLERLEFHGAKANVLPYFRNSSIFLMTSAFEGLSMTLLEAQQNGCVPIVFDTFSSVNDIVSDGLDGYIIPEGDEGAFTRKLASLMENQKLRSEMSQNAIHMCQKFELAKILDDWCGEILNPNRYV